MAGSRPNKIPVLDPVFVPDRRKADLEGRLRKIAGQVDGISRMLQANRPCLEILTQIASAQEAMRGLNREMARNYLERCATDAIKAGRGAEVFEPLLSVIYRLDK